MPDSDADDLTQSTIERALRARGQWKPGSRLDSWLYKIMRNLAADLALKIRNTGLTIRQYQLLLSGQQKPPAR